MCANNYWKPRIPERDAGTDTAGDSDGLLSVSDDVMGTSSKQQQFKFNLVPPASGFCNERGTVVCFPGGGHERNPKGLSFSRDVSEDASMPAGPAGSRLSLGLSASKLCKLRHFL